MRTKVEITDKREVDGNTQYCIHSEIIVEVDKVVTIEGKDNTKRHNTMLLDAKNKTIMDAVARFKEL